MDKLASDNKSGGETYASADDRKGMYALADSYIDYLSASKTEREAVAGVIARLSAAGFTEGFSTGKGWQSLYGKAIFAARRGRRVKLRKCSRPVMLPRRRQRELDPMTADRLQGRRNRLLGRGRLPDAVPLAVDLQKRHVLGFVQREG